MSNGKLCESLRSLLEEKEPVCKSIDVRCAKDHIACDYDDLKIVYAEPNWKYQENQQNAAVVLNDDYRKIAFADLEWTLNNPKLELETLDFHTNDPNCDERGTLINGKDWFKGQYECFIKMLDSLKHQISVKTIFYRYFDAPRFFKLLPHLKPGVLEKIILTGIPCEHVPYDEEGMRSYEKLASMEQWKQAQELQLRYCVYVFPFKFATNFKRFSMEYVTLRANEVVELRDYFAKLDNFEHCSIRSHGQIDAYGFRLSTGERAPANDKTEYVSHYSIPDSEDYLECMFFINENRITIEKKKKQ